MKYYSEVLNKNFDTIEDLESAEKAEKKKVLAKAKEDAARTEEINAAKEAVKKATEAYVTALKVCWEKLSLLKETDQRLLDLEKKNTSPSNKGTDFSWVLGDFYNIFRGLS